MADRHVILGLARSRARWFGELTRWETTAIAPIEVVKTLTVEEATAVITTGRPVSVVLLDAELPRFDRSVIAEAARHDVPTILVGRNATRDWESLGCAARIDDDFERDALVELLDRIAPRIPSGRTRRTGRVELAAPAPRGHLIGVIGTGGSGTSTIAMAIAQSWAEDDGDVVLVDGCRRADLAMYHDVGDVIPGLPELVEMHRGDDADPAEIRGIELDSGRGYRLVLGLRRPRDWAGLRSSAVAASIDGLRRTHEAVVVDLDPDLETESETGSADIEDRHAVTLAVARAAGAMVVVTGSDLKGTHDAAWLLEGLRRIGASPDRLVVVANRAPRSPVTRAATARAIRSLGGDEPMPVEFVRIHRGLESIQRTAERLPAGIGRGPLHAVRRMLVAPVTGPTVEPEPVRIGELGALSGSST